MLTVIAQIKVKQVFIFLNINLDINMHFLLN